MGASLLRTTDVQRLLAFQEGHRTAPDLLSLFVQWEIASHGGCRFVQVGANDGQREDPLRRHILANGLSGLMIEPNAAPFGRLVEAYRDRPAVKAVQAAIGTEDGTVDLFVFDRAVENGHQLDLLSSLDRSILDRIKRQDGLLAQVVAMPVPQRKLTSLVVEQGFADASLLLIDTEGYDYEVLKTIDVEVFAPRMIQLEHIYLGGPSLAGAVKWLADRQYSTLFTHSELVGVRI
jgi:FkbM family methyltransferase